MKKKLIIAAVGAALSMGAMTANAAATVYGVGHVSIDNVSYDDGTTNPTADNGLNVTSRASRVGVKAAEDLGGGLTAVAQVEIQYDLADSAAQSYRNSFVGLAGGFGTFVLGTHDTPYKLSTAALDPFADTAADFNAVIGTPAGLENRLGNVIAYISPNMGGFTLAAAVVTDETGGADDESFFATSIAGMYSAGPLYVSVAAEDVKDVDSTNTAGQSGVRVGVSYDFGVAKPSVVVESGNYTGVKGTADNDFTSAVVNVVVPFAGNNAFIAEYGMHTKDKLGAQDADQETTLMGVGVAHLFSKTTTAYVAYGTVSTEAFNNVSTNHDRDTKVLTAGMKVVF